MPGENIPTGAKSLAKQADSRGWCSKGTLDVIEGALLFTLKMWHAATGIRLVAEYKDGKFAKGYAWAPWFSVRRIGARDMAGVLKGTVDPTPENPVPEGFRDVCVAYAVEKYDGTNY